MARIFVSYSHKNTDFCKRLTDGLLLKQEMDFWVDWEGIPPTVDWMKEIEKGIEEADTFLAIITPEWIASKVCKDELAIAVKNGKRMIPVVAYKGDWNEVPPALAQFNYIPFTEDFDYNTQLDKLFTALDTDYDWLKNHRRLQVKALEWERSNKEGGFLLHGKDLEEAEQQISVNANKDPHPTDIQREYILISRQATERQRRITIGSLSAAVIVMLGIIIALLYSPVAEWIAQRAAQGELVPIAGGDFYVGATDPSVIETGERRAWLVKNKPAFSIEKYEVTNDQYRLCVEYGSCTAPSDTKYFPKEMYKDFPVLGVSVVQANIYCLWVGRRLPTELEWIRSARGLNDPRFWPWDDDLAPNSDLANMPFATDTQATEPKPVTSYSKNISPDGVRNLVGNALEWTSSYYQDGYYYGNEDYDFNNNWDGQVNTYDGNKAFIRLGGGWQRPISHLAEIAPFAGFNTDENTGMRCASD